jgi:hypothetical protein
MNRPKVNVSYAVGVEYEYLPQDVQIAALENTKTNQEKTYVKNVLLGISPKKQMHSAYNVDTVNTQM